VVLVISEVVYLPNPVRKYAVCGDKIIWVDGPTIAESKWPVL
jgi:hypothetical protein